MLEPKANLFAQNSSQMPHQSDHLATIFGPRDVVAGNLCVGCGACAVVAPSVTMSRNQYGVMQASFDASTDDQVGKAALVCPFSDASQTEDQIAESRFQSLENFDRKVGFYANVYAGRVAVGANLENSSSGGLTSWLCAQLMKRGLVDGVIHVGPARLGRGELYEFVVSNSVAELEGRKKSQYYSVSFNQALGKIRGDGRSYVFVGVPCYVKAIRNLCLQDQALDKQIRFALGLVCGHMKSAAFAELMAWQVGVAPTELKRVDFRKKIPDLPSTEYSFAAFGIDSVEHAKTAHKLIGGNWGHATFQLESCDYCDDIFAETADAVLGDAWLPQYAGNWQGTNVVATRNKILSDLLDEGRSSGELSLDTLAAEDLIKSQEGNFRHRWDGLSVRLQDDQERNIKRPKKRISAGSRNVDARRLDIVRLRKKMAIESHKLFLEAKKRSDLKYYMKAIAPLASQMSRASAPPLQTRVLRKIQDILRRLIR